MSHGILALSYSILGVLLTVSHGVVVGILHCVTCTCHHGVFTIDGHLLAGVQNRLKHNIHGQRLGQKAAEDVELEAIRRQSNYRVEVSSEMIC